MPPSWRYPGPNYWLKTDISEVLGICPVRKKEKDAQPGLFSHRREHEP